MDHSPLCHSNFSSNFVRKMLVIIVVCGQEIAIEIGFQQSVSSIKRNLEQFLGIPAEAQTLSVSGWELLDGLDMEDYPIVTNGTKIDLAVNNVTKMQLTIKFSSKQIDIEVDRAETVQSLKEKIHIIDAIPIKRMSLFFSGVELVDDCRSLIEYGVSEFSEIFIFLKPMNRTREEQPLPRRSLDIVVQMSSSLNAAAVPLEMESSSSVNDLREFLVSSKIIPQDDYLFIHKQRIMHENCSLRWHGVENGDWIYVFRGTVSRSEC